MVSTVENAKEMSFLDISETYPDTYILVKIIEINHKDGAHTGVALYISDNWDDLIEIRKKENMLQGSIIVTGENLIPVMGGIL